METIDKIRCRHKVRGESISAIAHDLNLSRNTVKKYLKAEIDPVYRREGQPAPKLGAFQSTLETWLEQDSQRPRGQRRSAQRLFEDLQREGYAGAYDSVPAPVGTPLSLWCLPRVTPASSTGATNK